MVYVVVIEIGTTANIKSEFTEAKKGIQSKSFKGRKLM